MPIECTFMTYRWPEHGQYYRRFGNDVIYVITVIMIVNVPHVINMSWHW